MGDAFGMFGPHPSRPLEFTAAGAQFLGEITGLCAGHWWIEASRLEPSRRLPDVPD